MSGEMATKEDSKEGGDKKHKLNFKESNKPNKRKKSSFPPFKNWKKHTKIFQSAEIIRGVLITGEHSREGPMIGEVLHSFKFFVDLFYPHLSGLSPIPAEVSDESTEGNEEESKEATKLKLFEVINSGCSGMAIISFLPKELEPVEFTRRMLEHIIDKKEPRPTFSLEFTNRIVPLEATCEVSPSLDRLVEVSTPVIHHHFNNKPACKFAIRVEHRNCNNFDRKKCIDALVPLVGEAHKVDLNNPDLVIMVQIFKSAAGVSVLPQYNKLRKYNIQEVFKAAEEEKQAEEAEEVEEAEEAEEQEEKKNRSNKNNRNKRR